jgi:hypothetical protein
MFKTHFISPIGSPTTHHRSSILKYALHYTRPHPIGERGTWNVHFLAYSSLGKPYLQQQTVKLWTLSVGAGSLTSMFVHYEENCMDC